MKTICLVHFLFLFLPIISFAQANELEIDSLSSLIQKDIGEANTMLSPINWKFLSGSIPNRNSRLSKVYTFGYFLKISNKIPKALAWLDVGVRGGRIVDIRYAFGSGDDYKYVLEKLKEMGTKQLDTSTPNGAIRTDFIDDKNVYNLVSVPVTHNGNIGSYYLEIQDLDFYYKRK